MTKLPTKTILIPELPFIKNLQNMIFKDRKDAGQKLAAELSTYEGQKDSIILGLPRGGVVVAYEVADKLGLPLDIVVPRKIGAPGNEEYAIGAISEDGKPIIDEEAKNMSGASEEYINQTMKKERTEAQRRIKIYRGKRKALELKGKTAILIDDGIATGHTMLAAISSVKAKGAKKIIVAVPISSGESLQKIKKETDKVICLSTPITFIALGQFYQHFDQTKDEEVIKLMKKTFSSTHF